MSITMLNSDGQLISPYSVLLLGQTLSHENTGNDHQGEDILTFKQIFSTSTIRTLILAE